MDSWAFAIDYAVPLHRRLTWRGENFVGSNLVPFQGGIIQGVAFLQPVATAPPTRFNRIGAGGGWTELIVKATSDNRNVFYLGVSDDDPRDKHLLTGSARSRNAMAWASISTNSATKLPLHSSGAIGSSKPGDLWAV